MLAHFINLNTNVRNIQEMIPLNIALYMENEPVGSAHLTKIISNGGEPFLCSPVQLGEEQQLFATLTPLGIF